MARKRIDELDLVCIAERQRVLMLVALAMIVGLVGQYLLSRSGNQTPALFWTVWGLQIVLAIIGTIAMARLYMALGENPLVAVVIGFLLLVPVIGLLILLAASSQSSTILKLAGARVGLFGVSKPEREKLYPGHCKGCGYPRESLEVLAPCPECGRVPIVW